MKKAISYIFLTLYIISTWNVFIVDAAIGDIGHWRDSIGGQIPGTTFGGFNFDQQVRNDGIYTKPNNNTIQFSEAGDYLVIATIRGVDNSNGRYNAQARVALTAGTGNIFSSYYTGYSRDNSENTAWFRAVGVVIGASANAQVQVQRRRDTDAPTSGSVPNQSDVQVIRLSQSNYGLYNIGGTGNAYGGTTPNTVDITSVVSQSNTAAIEGNITTDTVTLKGDNKKYLVAWSVSFDTGGARTQRIGHLEYDNVDKLSTRSYCYQRSTANEYCGIGSMDVIQTSTADIAVQSEVFRGPGVAADQGGADDDGNAVTDGNGQMIILEMPDYLEVFRSEDNVGLQDVTSAQTLNIARNVNFNNPLSFTKNSDSLVNVTNPADIFSWANIWTARSNIASGSRLTAYGSITIGGVKQTVGEHGNYSRGNQGTQDTFGLSFHPAGIFTTTGVGTTLGVSTDPLAGTEGGGTDRTQAGTVGFFALNLDTLVAPSLSQSAYRFFANTNSTDVGAVLAGQNVAGTLSSDGQAFRLRSLMSVTQNKLRQNEKTFKLQFAQKVGTCDTSFTGEVYTDVTTTSAIAYNNNATPADEAALTANANDPVNGATPVINQSYQELNNFSTSVATIPKDQDGKWDFSLIDNTAPDSTSYCFRIVESNGTLLNTYTVIPEITTSAPVLTPGPGGVSTGLNLWLKSNVGTSTTTNGANLTTWNDQSGNGKNATAVTAPTYRNNTTDNVNFYPVVNFNGTNQSMTNTTGGMSSKNYFAVVIPTNTTNGTTPGGVPFGLECTNATVNTGTCGLPFGGIVLGSFTAAIPDEVMTHALGASTNWRSSETGVANYDAGKPMLISVNENAAGNGTDIYEKGNQVNNYTANTYQFVTGTNYSIGSSRDGTYPFYFNGKIAEVINFNNRLSDSDRIKVESYLSLKYGITLKNGTQNYIASDGSTVMWNAATAGSYTNGIFGVGRDTLQSLGQVQAKSINNDAVVSLVALGEGTNITPAFVDIADKEFLTISNDNLGNTWTASNSPAGFNILTRKWKIQEVGDVGTISLTFDVANTNFDIPAPSLGTNYYFVRDSNNNGLLSDETPTLMTNLGGNQWQISGINPGTGQIFTIASQASTNNIPTDITLSNNTINENVAANSAIGTLSTTDADILDTHTYSLVPGTGDEQNSFFTIVGNTLQINHSPDYEIRSSYNVRIQTNDGNGGTFQKQFTININNLSETTTSFLDFENTLNNYKYTVTSGNWSPTTTNPYAGTRSMQSNNGGVGNTQSCFEISHNSTTTGTMDFYYNVSSQAGADFLRFYIDNVEQGTGWSGTVPWTQYTSGSISAGAHIYKWCYIKDAATNTGLDTAFIDNITFTNTAVDTTPPTITSQNFASGALLPGGNHNIIIGYTDLQSGINTASANMELYKWNGTTWGANIAGTGLGTSTITATSSTYPTNNLSSGKYLYAFQIADNAGNVSSVIGAVFYIDTPEIIIGSGAIDIGIVNHLSPTFSGTVTITVKTIGAGFNVIMNRTSPLSEGVENIESWNGIHGYGYQKTPYSGSITAIGTNEVIATQAANINTNGVQNTYTYNIQLGALIEQYKEAGNYEGNIDFGVILDY